MNKLNEKLTTVRELMSRYKSAAVAFSGGVDSTLLLKVALDIFGERTLAITASSSVQINNEMAETKRIAAYLGARHLIIGTDEMKHEEYVSNPVNRCYHCKFILYGALLKVAKEREIETVFDGTNADDTFDYRPGLKALSELKIISPLKEAGLTKPEIRELSVRFGLNTSSKPAMACLSSRIPYGERITDEKLRRIDAAETFIRSKGFAQVRVRSHDKIARIEVEPEKIRDLFENDAHKEIEQKLKSLGYLYVTVDLKGYQTGSLNKMILKDG